jgi:hypothetical protein
VAVVSKIRSSCCEKFFFSSAYLLSCHLSAHKPQSVEQVFATCKQGSSKIAHVNRKARKGQNLDTTQHEYTNLH